MTHDPLDLIPDDRKLDLEVARKVFGYRWVRWSERTAGAKADEYRNGRFLAPPDHAAAPHEKPAEEALCHAVLDALSDSADVDDA